MPRPFYDNLYALALGVFGDFRVYDKFLNLGAVSAIVDSAGPEAISEAKDDVMLFHDGYKTVDLFIERIFPSCYGSSTPSGMSRPG